jgi:hypothetical protein
MSPVCFRDGHSSGDASAASKRFRGGIGRSAAAVTIAVPAFVIFSLAFSWLLGLSLRSVGLVGDDLAQGAGYVGVAALAMIASRRLVERFIGAYRGRWVLYSFLVIDIVLITLALASRRLQVDYLATLFRMATVCLFAYLQFWNRGGAKPEDS